MNKNIVIALVVVVAIAIGGYMFPTVTVVEKISDSLGVSAGPEHTEHQVFLQGYTTGGRIVATSSPATSTLQATDLITRSGQYTSWLKYTPTLGSSVKTTVNLPATSTLSHFIPKAGQCYTMKYENAATAATTTVIAAGTGMDLQEFSGGNVEIGQNNYAFIEFCRDTNSNMVVSVTETVPAD